jgi:hypothetical protein
MIRRSFLQSLAALAVTPALPVIEQTKKTGWFGWVEYGVAKLDPRICYVSTFLISGTYACEMTEDCVPDIGARAYVSEDGRVTHIKNRFPLGVFVSEGLKCEPTSSHLPQGEALLLHGESRHKSPRCNHL